MVAEMAITSSATAEAARAEAAELTKLQDRGAWTPTIPYAVNDQVTDAGIVYQCTVAHTSGASFTGVGWSQRRVLAGADVPAAGGYSQVSGTYTNLFAVQASGGTDAAGPFDMIVGAGTYGTSPAIIGPVMMLGYNALQGAEHKSGPYGAAALSFFADAGDTNSSGAHGVEINLSWFGPDGLTDNTGAFQMVAVNDTTNTVNTLLRCGTGNSGGYSSNITFENANASTVFMQMSNANANITMFQPVVFEQPITFIDTGGIISPLTLKDATGNSSMSVTSVNSGATANITLNGTNAGTASEIQFAASGSVKWRLEHTPPCLFIQDAANSRSALYLYPGSTTANSKMFVNSVIQSTNSIVCGSAALATTATDGFLYLPTCAGPPTGMPTAWTGTVPVVFDTTDDRLYFRTEGSWKFIAG
jgi:hypothetical protein